MSTSKEPRGRDLVLHAAVISAPLIFFTSIVFLFSEYRISPNPAVEASAANPLGLLTSNFVYDGSINVENIVLSSVFLLVVCLYYPRELRIFMVYFVPIVAVAAGGLAELTAISSPYVSIHVCAQSCSFYGMSAVASAMVGFTVASFFICFGLIVVQRTTGRPVIRKSDIFTERTGLRGQAILVSAFVVYVVLLLFFSGAIALPSAPSGHQSPGGSSPPPAIFTQTAPVALVHTASITYGFLLCLATFALVNRRYHVFVSPAGQDRV
ncbi:MAG: hypothetical protein OK449_00910 [Thaumarchaeota archaeon]|nr:hypothetical protein [Nitrososphaerota archaeon]